MDYYISPLKCYQILRCFSMIVKINTAYGIFIQFESLIEECYFNDASFNYYVEIGQFQRNNMMNNIY